ncbi:hypothetical protein D3C85_580870 [compost metagenome]
MKKSDGVKDKAKWLKPSELPEGFWSECFVVCAGDGEVLQEINMVKKENRKVMWYSDVERTWYEFHKQVDTRLMVIEYPEIPNDLLKG